MKQNFNILCPSDLSPRRPSYHLSWCRICWLPGSWEKINKLPYIISSSLGILCFSCFKHCLVRRFRAKQKVLIIEETTRHQPQTDWNSWGSHLHLTSGVRTVFESSSLNLWCLPTSKSSTSGGTDTTRCQKMKVKIQCQGCSQSPLLFPEVHNLRTDDLNYANM